MRATPAPPAGRDTAAWARSASTPGRWRRRLLLLKGTGRRVGEIVSLHLDCLDIDEHSKLMLVYDNHKAARIGGAALADTALVEAIRAQQAWMASRFPQTRASSYGCCHGEQEHQRARPSDRTPDPDVAASLVTGVPRLDAAGTGDDASRSFDRAASPARLPATYADAG